MKRLTVEVYDDVHHKIKLVAFSRGITIKALMLEIINKIIDENIIHQSDPRNQ